MKRGFFQLLHFFWLALAIPAPLIQGGETRGGASEAPKPAVKTLEAQWLDAVERGEARAALGLAEKIVGDSAKDCLIDMWYLQLLKMGGIGGEYLTASFNELDFKLWSDALFFKKKANELLAGKRRRAAPIENLFQGLVEKVKPGEDDISKPPWPRHVWDSGRGMCDRMSWTLCELAYQAGFETAVIYLIDPETGSSPHTVCEVRDGVGGRWLADPLKGKILSGVSAGELAGSAVLKKELWSGAGEEQRWKCIENAHVMIPAYPQDFRPLNQKLYAKLSKELGNGCPRFGADPRKRIGLFKGLIKEKPPVELKIGVYDFPFLLMAQELKKAPLPTKPPPGK